MISRRSPSRAAALALAVGAALLGCAGAEPPSPEPAPPPRARRVVLLSFDGTAAQELHRLEAAGRLAGGGFERFFEQGEVAGGLVPVNPTLTAPSHASLATGYPPGATGIVSNSFHIPGEPFLERANGFSVPIGTETLWEAARRQGKRVGVVTWPSADDAGSRRRGDWGLTWTNSTLRGSQTLEVARQDWRPVEETAPLAGPRSFSPRLAVTVTLPETRSLPAQDLELVAIDRADDGRAAYDALLVRLAGWRSGEPLGAGEWLRLEQETTPGETTGVSWAKLLALAPDLGRTRLYLGAAYRAHAYPESFARRLDGAELWWPGPPDDRALEEGMEGKPGIDLATWVEQAERFTTFFFEVMRLAAREEAWDLLLGYVPSNDEAGHELLLVDPRQRGYTPALAGEFAAARERVFRGVDRELGRLLGELDLATTAVAVVSDHGMAPSHTSIDVASLLLRWGYLETNDAGEPEAAGTRAIAVTSTSLGHVYLHLRGREPQGGVEPAEAPALVADLARRFRELTIGGERPIAAVYTRQEAAAIGLDHPHSGDLLLFAVPGYAFHSERRPSVETPTRPASSLGQHGYLSRERAMHGIFLALGAGVEAARPERVDALAVAPRVAAWLGVSPPRPVPPE